MRTLTAFFAIAVIIAFGTRYYDEHFSDLRVGVTPSLNVVNATSHHVLIGHRAAPTVERPSGATPYRTLEKASDLTPIKVDRSKGEPMNGTLCLFDPTEKIGGGKWTVIEGAGERTEFSSSKEANKYLLETFGIVYANRDQDVSVLVTELQILP